MADQSLRFLRDPDQDARRQELRLFIGPNADTFLRTYDTLYAQYNPGTPAAAGLSRFGGFSVAAMLLGPIWLLYRKMWAWAAGLIVLGVVLGFIPHVGGAGIGLAAALGATGRRLYLYHAIRKIMEVRSRWDRSGAAAATGSMPPPPGAAAPSYAAELAKAGGTSPAAAWIAGGIVFIFFALALLGGIVLMHQHG